MKKLLCSVALLALLGSACGGGSGGPDPAEDPKGALVSAFENLSGESQTITFTIASTPESLNALASTNGGAGMTPEDAQKLLDSSLTISSEGTGEDAKAQILANVAGNDGAVEMRILGKDFYVRADVAGLMEQFGADTSSLDGVAAQAEAQGLTFVRPAIDGEWLAIKGLADQLGALTGGAATPGNMADQQAIVNQLTETLQSKATVTSEGDDDVGTHLVAALPIRDIYTEFMGTLQGLGGAVPMDQLPDPSEVPDEDVTVDIWVKDGKVSQVDLDFLQFAALAKEPVPAGVDQFAFRITFAAFSGDTSVPEGAVEVDPSVLFQGLLGGGMVPGGGAVDSGGGTSGFDCSQLEGQPKEVTDQFKDLCPNL
jgi:hypothetical protein